MHPRLLEVTAAVEARSREGRVAYLDAIDAAGKNRKRRGDLPCGNQAHGFAAAPGCDKPALKAGDSSNIAIVSAYTEMLSAHQPYGTYPQLIQDAARDVGATAQFAGGVPAMCDGITQGQPGMELSLFSRDVIAMGTAIALSHNTFDSVVCLGVCDKIVPGLLIGALSFGHLPVAFIPAGPMPTGLSNVEKSIKRQEYAEGKITTADLLETETKAYHAPGTCTFFGTANSNQMLMEIMGLHLPGASFIPPNTPLRDALTKEAARQVGGGSCVRLADVITAKTLINGVVGLLATGGSTNHTLHLVAIARAAGIRLTWDDFAALSEVVPLMARIHPNGPSDINGFQAAGGMGLLMAELLRGGFLHDDVQTVAGPGLARYTHVPDLEGETAIWKQGPAQTKDDTVIRPFDNPFAPQGGITVLDGNLGRAVSKISAVKPEHRRIEAPVAVFDSQADFLSAFENGALHRDVIAVLRFQGPRANGMPELHKLIPPLGVLQDLGYRVALVTDGRMSGASGKIPSAIHVTPEAAAGGALAKIQDGDVVRLDAQAGVLTVDVADADWQARPVVNAPVNVVHGAGRELFGLFRSASLSAEDGAMAVQPGAPW